MKKSIGAVTLLLTSSMLLMGFQKAGKDEKTVKLADVSASLAAFQGQPGFDFVGDSIIYGVIEKDNYDRIFRESAMIYASIIQVNGTIDGINKGTIPADGEFAIANVGFGVKDLPGMKDRITKLQAELQTLQPKSDFKGLEMKKAAKAADGINMAKKQLVKSTNLLPDVMENLSEVAKKVIKD